MGDMPATAAASQQLDRGQPAPARGMVNNDDDPASSMINPITAYGQSLRGQGGIINNEQRVHLVRADSDKGLLWIKDGKLQPGQQRQQQQQQQQRNRGEDNRYDGFKDRLRDKVEIVKYHCGSSSSAAVSSNSSSNGLQLDLDGDAGQANNPEHEPSTATTSTWDMANDSPAAHNIDGMTGSRRTSTPPRLPPLSFSSSSSDKPLPNPNGNGSVRELANGKGKQRATDQDADGVEEVLPVVQNGVLSTQPMPNGSGEQGDGNNGAVSTSLPENGVDGPEFGTETAAETDDEDDFGDATESISYNEDTTPDRTSKSDTSIDGHGPGHASTDADRLSLSSLPSPLSSISSAGPLPARSPKKGPLPPLSLPPQPSHFHDAAVVMRMQQQQQQQYPSAVIIPPTPPTSGFTNTDYDKDRDTTNALISNSSNPANLSPQEILSTPIKQSPRSNSIGQAMSPAGPSYHSTDEKAGATNAGSSSGGGGSNSTTRKSPPSHTRSLSFQLPLSNSSSSSSSQQLSALAAGQSGSFPVRRSSLMPPSPAGFSSSLPDPSSSSGSALRKRGSVPQSPSMRRGLSFRTTLYDEPEQLGSTSAERVPQSEEELADSIARQAERIRKERASKKAESERAYAKAALASSTSSSPGGHAAAAGGGAGASGLAVSGSQGQVMLAQGQLPKRTSSLRVDTSALGRDGTTLQNGQAGPGLISIPPQGGFIKDDNRAARSSSPTSPTISSTQHHAAWVTTPSQAGDNALVRSPVEGHFPSPVADGSQQLPNGQAVKPPEHALVGNLIGEDHVNYVLMYNMLTGIRIGVSRCEAKIQRPLTDEDYKAAHKFSFDIVGNELTPSAKYDFKFKDYAPWVFRELRAHFHLDPADYLLSLTAKYILSELGSPGKSGSFFYFSRDYRFIIKTISHTEHKFLRKILKQYHTHVIDNPHTLISRFYGLHRVKLPRGRKIHFVIMNNLFPPHRDIHETFDLKGSSIGREYPEEKARERPRATLKDLNWVHRDRHLEFGPFKRQLFEEQLKRDVLLLQRLRIMDYSLLVGIHDIKRGNSENLRDGLLTVFQPENGKLRRRPTIRGDLERQHEASQLRKAVQRSDPKGLNQGGAKLPDKDRSERRYFLFYQDEGGIRATNQSDLNENTIYYLGIIDILTPYNWYKQAEHFFRSFKYDGHRISAVPPQEYGDRFINFLFSIIRGGDVSKRPKME